MKKCSVLLWTLLSILLFSCSSESGTPEDKPSPTVHSQQEKALMQTLQSKKWVNTYFDPQIEDLKVERGRGTVYFLNDSIGVVTGYDRTINLNLELEEIWKKTFLYTQGFYYSVSGNKIIMTFYEPSGYKLVNIYTYEDDAFYDGEAFSKANSLHEPQSIDADDRTFMSQVAPIQGKSGSVEYYLDITTHTLKIYGKGAMADYRKGNQPWKDKLVQHVEIAEGVETIGQYAFTGFEYIEDVKLPNTLVWVGLNAFAGTGLTDLTIPASVVIIDPGAFDCYRLQTLNFSPKSYLRTIGDNAFASASIGQYQQLVLPDSLRIIGSSAFASSLYKGVVLNDGLEEIGDFAFGSYMFDGQMSEKIVIPNSVKSIGQLAFQGNFTEIQIGSGLQKLGNTAFQGNDMRGTVKINCKTPPQVNDGAVPVFECQYWTLYVPKGCRSAYATAEGWSRFGSIKEDASLDGGSTEEEPYSTATLYTHPPPRSLA